MKVGVYMTYASTFLWIVFTIKFNQMSISKRINKLEEKKLKYMNELEDLHISEPSEKWYKERRYELESQIGMIESVIHDLESEQKMMRPFFWTLLGFIFIAGIIVLYRFVKLKM